MGSFHATNVLPRLFQPGDLGSSLRGFASSHGACKIVHMLRIDSRRRLVAPVAVIVGLSLVLTSCFGGDDEEEEPGDGTTTTQQVAPPPAPTNPPTTTPVVIVEPLPPTTTLPDIFEDPLEPEVPVVVVEPPPPPQASDPPEAPVNYTVQQGDTLFSIAQRFGISLDELIVANEIGDPNVIYEGDTLTIPPVG